MPKITPPQAPPAAAGGGSTGGPPPDEAVTGDDLLGGLLPVDEAGEAWTARAREVLGPWDPDAPGPFGARAAIDAGEADGFVREGARRLADAGLFDAFVPPREGGPGTTPLVYRAAALLARRDASLAVVTGVIPLATLPLRVAGSPAQRARWFGRVRAGALCGIALTEWERGSDLAGTETRAERVRLGADGQAVPVAPDDDGFTHYRVTGAKNMINNGREGDFLVALVRTGAPVDPAAPKAALAAALGLSMLVIDRTTPGLEAGRRWRTHGFRAVDISDVHLRGALVPREDLLGREGQGFRIVRRTLETSRGGIGAHGVGHLLGALSVAGRHAARRSLYGGSIDRLPLVRDTLAEAWAALELVAALAAWSARATWAAPLSSRPVTAASKLFGTLEPERQIDALALVLGARGLDRDHAFERFRRDVRILPVFDGTAHVQAVELAGELDRLAEAWLAPDAGAAARASEGLELARGLWTTVGPEPDLLKGDGPLPAGDPAALDALDARVPGHGLDVVAAARRALARVVAARARQGTATPFGVDGEDGRLAMLFARGEATLALALRRATAAGAGEPAGLASAARRAAHARALAQLAEGTLAVVAALAPEQLDAAAGEPALRRALAAGRLRDHAAPLAAAALVAGRG